MKLTIPHPHYKITAELYDTFAPISFTVYSLPDNLPTARFYLSDSVTKIDFSSLGAAAETSLLTRLRGMLPDIRGQLIKISTPKPTI